MFDSVFLPDGHCPFISGPLAVVEYSHVNGGENVSDNPQYLSSFVDESITMGIVVLQGTDTRLLEKRISQPDIALFEC